MIHSEIDVPASRSLAHRLPVRTWLAAGASWLVACDARYRERRHMEALGDAALRDCGLDRADMADEAGKPFWRP